MKNKLKLLLLSIMSICVGICFCSADGVYWDSTGGLISIVYNDGNNILTLSDKNLGATCSDVNNSCSYGLYYQFGNNFGFDPSIPNYTYVSGQTPDNLSLYGPGNYYNSNGIFYGLLDSDNADIWGAVTGTPEAMQGPCPSGFHIIDNWSNMESIFTTYFNYYDASFFKSLLKMPTASYISNTDGLLDMGAYMYGNYWASSSYSTFDGVRVAYNDYYVASTTAGKSYGHNIRCIKNESVSPNYKWFRLYGDIITPTADIDIFYNNDNDYITVNCDGDTSIHINGTSTYSNNTFTPYFVIDYFDEDNQYLRESYINSILYLSGALFKKTYSGTNNDWILTNTSECSIPSFSGYLPSFDFTGSIDPNEINTGNVFNNFAENSVKTLLTNVPSYIQYVIIFMLLLFILGFIRKFKRR